MENGNYVSLVELRIQRLQVLGSKVKGTIHVHAVEQCSAESPQFFSFAMRGAGPQRFSLDFRNSNFSAII